MAKDKVIFAVWSPEQKEALIKEWEANPILYDTTNVGYAKPLIKRRVLEDIGMKLDPPREANDVMATMKSLRTQYLFRKRKGKDSIRSGAGRNDVYIPKWPYYELLNFLDLSNPIKESSSNMEKVDVSLEVEVDEDGEDSVVSTGTPANSPPSSTSSRSSFPPPIQSGLKKKRKREEEENELLKQSADVLSSLKNRMETREMDEADRYGAFIADEYRALNTAQRNLIKLKFQQALYEVQCQHEPNIVFEYQNYY